MFGPVLTLPRLALTTAAKALRVLASVNEALADRISSSVADGSASHPQGPPAPPRRNTATATRPATTDAVDEQAASSVAASTTDIAALAARTAPEVIAALEGLSATELADLYEQESRRRRRRTVLAAIEAAAAPPPSADDDLAVVDDVRQADELVYSTETPRR